MFKVREEAIAAPQFGRAVPAAALTAHQLAAPSLTERLAAIDLAPSLARNIGSRRWFRGLATMIGLGAAAVAFWPESRRSPPPLLFALTPMAATNYAAK